MIPTAGYAAYDATSDLKPYQFSRRQLQPSDVHIEILFCGICYTDIHTAKDEWGFTASWPVVPGHEITGVVKAVGSSVTKVKIGDKVGVGGFVDSCGSCGACEKKEEAYCASHVQTYGSECADGTYTQGGYSRDIVVNERFVLIMPKTIPLDSAAPLLCVGATVYSAIKHYGITKPGLKVGIIGLGGVGHVGVMILNAMGMEVAVISRSTSKKADAEKLGAKHFILSSDKAEMEKWAEKLDYILDTVPADKDMGACLDLLSYGGTLVTIGAPPKEYEIEVSPMSLIMRRKTIGGSLIGGTQETQEMLDFCGQHNIKPWIELIKMDEVNTAYKRMGNSDVKYRFVIDVANTAPQVSSSSS